MNRVRCTGYPSDIIVKNKTSHSRKKSKKAVGYSKARPLGKWIYILILSASLIFVGYSLYRWVCIKDIPVPRREVSSFKKVIERKKTVHESVKPGKSPEYEKAFPEERKTTPEAGNRIAIVIDDMGYDLRVLDEILRIDAPITLSVLPHLSHSVLIAERAGKAGREVILHLPMEPYGYPEKNPGEGALLLHMSRDELVAELESDIANIPGISGANNHMGSRFMEDEEKVAIVLNRLKERGLFFLDSLTTRQSKGIQVAGKIGLRHVERDVFLDNHCDFEKALAILNRIAEKKDSWHTIVIIGHPYESTIQAIEKSLPIFRERNINIVPLSDLVR